MILIYIDIAIKYKVYQFKKSTTPCLWQNGLGKYIQNFNGVESDDKLLSNT